MSDHNLDKQLLLPLKLLKIKRLSGQDKNSRAGLKLKQK